MSFSHRSGGQKCAIKMSGPCSFRDLPIPSLPPPSFWWVLMALAFLACSCSTAVHPPLSRGILPTCICVSSPFLIDTAVHRLHYGLILLTASAWPYFQISSQSQVLHVGTLAFFSKAGGGPTIQSTPNEGSLGSLSPFFFSSHFVLFKDHQRARFKVPLFGYFSWIPQEKWVTSLPIFRAFLHFY